MMKKRSVMIGASICLAFFVGACATFKIPAVTNEAPIAARALTKEDDGVRVSTSVVGDDEARRIFGVDLARKKIQAVWIAVENRSDRPIILLPTAIDPDYFTPLEVSFAYHKAFAGEANAALDAHLLRLNFPVRNLVPPGSRSAGYIFTNWTKGMKVVDVDLIGDDFSWNFTFFVANPDSGAGPDIVARITNMYAPSELRNLESDADLRRALEQLPCCASNEAGEHAAEPLNVVIIGAFDDWTTAFNRRGYRYQALNPRYAFGRVQDISGHKLSRGYQKAQVHAIRLWQTPIRYKGAPVWVGQTSTRFGGRFAEKAPIEVTSPIDPKVDEARYDLAQDLAYSQALTKIGFTKGAGRVGSTATGAGANGVRYTSDGLRAVLVFKERPASLAEIDFFDWERLRDYQ